MNCDKSSERVEELHCLHDILSIFKKRRFAWEMRHFINVYVEFSRKHESGEHGKRVQFDYLKRILLLSQIFLWHKNYVTLCLWTYLTSRLFIIYLSPNSHDGLFSRKTIFWDIKEIPALRMAASLRVFFPYSNGKRIFNTAVGIILK